MLLTQCCSISAALLSQCCFALSVLLNQCCFALSALCSPSVALLFRRCFAEPVLLCWVSTALLSQCCFAEPVLLCLTKQSGSLRAWSQFLGISSWQRSPKTGCTIPLPLLLRIKHTQWHWKPETLIYRSTMAKFELSSWLCWLMAKSKYKTQFF